MIKSITKKTNNKKGFTLIELVVVIAILGILAAIAIPRFSGTLTNARSTADDSVERVLQSAVSLYMAENDGAIPALIDLEGDYIEADPTWSDDDEITAITIDANGTITAYTPARP